MSRPDRATDVARTARQGATIVGPAEAIPEGPVVNAPVRSCLDTDAVRIGRMAEPSGRERGRAGHLWRHTIAQHRSQPYCE
jgi:hypothetical protein